MKAGTRKQAEVGDPIGGCGFERPARQSWTASLSAFLLAVVPALTACASHEVSPNRPVPIKTAAPIAAAAPIPAVSPSRKVFVAPVKSAQVRAPTPPKATVLSPSGLGSFEKTRLPREEIQDYQSALCLPRDGSVVSLRKGMIDFFRRKDVDDPERAALIERRGLLQGDMDELSKLSINLHCGQN